MVVVAVALPMVVMLLLLLLNVMLGLLHGDRMLVRMLVPIRMMRIDPIGMMIVPPVAIVPFVSLVEVAFIAPFGMILSPFGMVFVEPAAVVLMPPVGLVPLVIRTVGTPSIAVFHLSPDVGMVLHELPQLRMLVSPIFVVNQVGIALEFALHRRVTVQKIVQALLVVKLSARRRRHHRHREQHNQNGRHDLEMLHIL